MAHRLVDIFDSVVLLPMPGSKTDSGIAVHDCARHFAKHLPTFFLKFDLEVNQTKIEKTDQKKLFILGVSRSLSEETRHTPLDIAAFENLDHCLREMGSRNRLIWSCNPYVNFLMEKWARHFRIFHPAQWMFQMATSFSADNNDPAKSHFMRFFNKQLSLVDLIVSDSAKSEKLLRSNLQYKGELLRLFPHERRNSIIRPEFYQRLRKGGARPQKRRAKLSAARKKPGQKLFYHGPIDQELDYKLLTFAAEKLPEWQFNFCGKYVGETASPLAKKFSSLSNVKFFEPRTGDEIALLASKAAAAILPISSTKSFQPDIETKVSEYWASGLPVIATEAVNIQPEPGVVELAKSGAAFVEKIKSVSTTRFDRSRLAKRLIYARRTTIDQDFDKFHSNLINKVADMKSRRKLNILVLYCEKSTANRGLRLSLEAIKENSPHNIYFLPATTWAQSPPYAYTPDPETSRTLFEEYGFDRRTLWDFEIFDAVIIHYSVRLAFDFILADPIARLLQKFEGPKLLYIQDEYERTETARKWMDILKFDIVYSCVPARHMEVIYPKKRFPHTKFTNVLTGYVSPDLKQNPVRALRDREIAIAYRGRQLSHRYGKLGYEKREIGIKVKEYAEKRGVKTDIEWDDKERIYENWLDFLGSARATLATESGSNMFDFDGHLLEKAEAWKEVGFEEAYKAYFSKFDNVIEMGQVSPKIFEAIALKTALICFKGNYSGVIEPDIHYIPLNKDFSNIEQVFEKLFDDEYITKMTEQAYNDVIISGRYDIKKHMRLLNRDIESLSGPKSQARIINTPIAINKNTALEPLYRNSAAGFLLNDQPLNLPNFRSSFLSAFEDMKISSSCVARHSESPNLLYHEWLQSSPYDEVGDLVRNEGSRRPLPSAQPTGNLGTSDQLPDNNASINPNRVGTELKPRLRAIKHNLSARLGWQKGNRLVRKFLSPKNMVSAARLFRGKLRAFMKSASLSSLPLENYHEKIAHEILKKTIHEFGEDRRGNRLFDYHLCLNAMQYASQMTIFLSGNTKLNHLTAPDANGGSGAEHSYSPEKNTAIQVENFIKIMLALGFPSRDITVFHAIDGNTDIQTHRVAEIFFAAAWRMFDIGRGWHPYVKDIENPISFERACKEAFSICANMLNPGFRQANQRRIKDNWAYIERQEYGVLYSNDGIICPPLDEVSNKFVLKNLPAELGWTGSCNGELGNAHMRLQFPDQRRRHVTLRFGDLQTVSGPASINSSAAKLLANGKELPMKEEIQISINENSLDISLVSPGEVKSHIHLRSIEYSSDRLV